MNFFIQEDLFIGLAFLLYSEADLRLLEHTRWSAGSGELLAQSDPPWMLLQS